MDFLLIDARYWKSKSCSVVLVSENETLLCSFGFLHSYFQDACMASDVCRLEAKHKWTLTPGAAYFKYCDVDKFKCSAHSRQCWHFVLFCFNSLIYCRCMIALIKSFPFFSWVKSQELVYDEIFIIKIFLHLSGLMV